MPLASDLRDSHEVAIRGEDGSKTSQLRRQDSNARRDAIVGSCDAIERDMTRCHARLRGAPSELAGPRCGHAMHGRGLNSHRDQLRSCGDPGPVENVRYIESYMKLLLERSQITYLT